MRHIKLLQEIETNIKGIMGVLDSVTHKLPREDRAICIEALQHLEAAAEVVKRVTAMQIQREKIKREELTRGEA